MTTRAAVVVVVLIVAAVMCDAVVGTVRIGHPGSPIVTWCVVTAIALTLGPSGGVPAGFGAGIVLDLLAGPAMPGGVHGLVGLALGGIIGALRPRTLGPVGAGVGAGAPGVVVGTVATLAVQMPITSLPVGVVVAAAAAAAVACPMVIGLIVRATTAVVPHRVEFH